MCTLNLYSLVTLKKYYSAMTNFYFTAGPKCKRSQARYETYTQCNYYYYYCCCCSLLYQPGAPHFVSSPHLTNSVLTKHDSHSPCAQKCIKVFRSKGD